jgi:TonB family protein
MNPLVTQHYREDSLAKSIRASLLIHALLLFLALIRAYLLKDHSKPYVPSLRVDLVALPDLLKNEVKRAHHKELQKELSEILKNAEKKAQRIQHDQAEIKIKQAPTPVKPQDMTLSHQNKDKPKNSYEQNRKAIDRLKLLAKIQDRLTAETHPNQQKTLLMKGNKLSKGSSIAEDARESSEESYFDLLKDRLQENWSLPPWIARQNLSAQVEIRIDAHGNLAQIQFVRPSGSPQFDEAVKKTIQMSQPFPTPPEEVRLSLQKHGILIGFPL